MWKTTRLNLQRETCNRNSDQSMTDPVTHFPHFCLPSRSLTVPRIRRIFSKNLFPHNTSLSVCEDDFYEDPASSLSSRINEIPIHFLPSACLSNHDCDEILPDSSAFLQTIFPLSSKCFFVGPGLVDLVQLKTFIFCFSAN